MSGLKDLHVRVSALRCAKAFDRFLAEIYEHVDFRDFVKCAKKM